MREFVQDVDLCLKEMPRLWLGDSCVWIMFLGTYVHSAWYSVQQAVQRKKRLFKNSTFMFSKNDVSSNKFLSFFRRYPSHETIIQPLRFEEERLDNGRKGVKCGLISVGIL